MGDLRTIQNLVAQAARATGLDDDEDMALFEPMRAAAHSGREPRKAPSTDELKARRLIQRKATTETESKGA